jgi:hypothetical protein
MHERGPPTKNTSLEVDTYKQIKINKTYLATKQLVKEVKDN